jgi:GNAT superfamily N-acetyltransferase
MTTLRKCARDKYDSEIEMRTQCVETLIAPDISDADITRLATLLCAVYPGRWTVPVAAEELRQKVLADAGLPANRRTKRFIIRDGDRIVARATIFPREVATTSGSAVIGALRAVMTHPDVRGQGLGKLIVRAAFDCVDRGEFACALFQTGDARDFYEKLGCRVVTNRIVNSLNRQDPTSNPFWDTWVMSYGDCPPGDIDLLGPGY